MSFASKYNTIFWAMAPLIAIYRFSGQPIYFLLILLMIVVNMGYMPRLLIGSRQELHWFFSILIVSFIGLLINSESYFDKSLFINNLVTITLFFSALIICKGNFNVTLFKKTVYLFAVATALVCVFQRAQLMLTGTTFINFFIPGLEISRDLDSFTQDRVSAFFTEPAHASIYMLPVFYLSLSERKKILAIVLATGILFTGSTTGFVILFALVICHSLKNGAKFSRIFAITLFSAIIAYIVYKLFPNIIEMNVSKLNESDSQDIRLLGMLQYTSLFDYYQYIFGVGFNQFSNFLKMHHILLISEWGIEYSGNYANAILYSFLCYGIIGLIFFINYLYKTIKKYKIDLGFIIYALGILVSDQVLFNMNLLYLLSFIIIPSTLLTKSSTNEIIIPDNSILL